MYRTDVFSKKNFSTFLLYLLNILRHHYDRHRDLSNMHDLSVLYILKLIQRSSSLSVKSQTDVATGISIVMYFKVENC